jgi:hypothetical protein
MPRSESLGPELLALLDGAEAALARGELRAAEFEIQRSLLVRRTSRAHVLLTRIACAQRDIGKARAALFGVAVRDRPRALKACAELGVELD